jgi:hypothetical protein
MNKIILITLGVLMFVGVSYQAKRTYDAHHSNGGTSSAENGGNSVTGQSGANGQVGANGQISGTNGTGTNGQGQTGQGTVQLDANGKPIAGSSSSNLNGNVAINGVKNGTTGSATAPVKVEPEKPKDNCFVTEYRHKKEAQSQDIENFLDYTNAFPLAANFNPKSLCVKVNQKAVNFTVAKHAANQEVRVGSMVGPESVIRVSYCVGKVNPCHEKCDQPKKRFMDDLMSDATDDDSFSDSWGKGEDEAHKKELKAKAKELRSIASENDHINEGSVQRNWDELQKTESFCK